MKGNKVCLIYNYPQHYREEIFLELDRALKIDFYFGDKMDDVKDFESTNFINCTYQMKNIMLYKGVYFQKGYLKPILNKYYKSYIILGDLKCINNWILLITKKLLNKKVLIWTHGYYGKESLLQKSIKRLFYSLGDRVLLYGNYSKDLMLNDFKASKLNVIYNSINFHKINKILPGLKLTDKSDVFRIVFIGRLTKVKKLDLLINLIQRIKNKIKEPVILDFIGEGEERTHLEKLVENNNLQSVIKFHGAIFNETQIGKILYNSDICISPGNVGLTAIHSISYGTPVATHNNFSLQMPEFEIIQMNNHNGFFFEMNNLDDLEVKILEYHRKIFPRNALNRLEKKKIVRASVDNFYNPKYQANIIINDDFIKHFKKI